jgi:hypothetical protein
MKRRQAASRQMKPTMIFVKRHVQSEDLEEWSLRTPHHALQIRILCIIGRTGLFLDFSLGSTRFFIFFLQLLDPLTIPFC